MVTVFCFMSSLNQCCMTNAPYTDGIFTLTGRGQSSLRQLTSICNNSVRNVSCVTAFIIKSIMCKLLFDLFKDISIHLNMYIYCRS